MITGASGYLGHAMAEELSEDKDAFLILVGRHREKVGEVEFFDNNRMLRLAGLDLTLEQDVYTLVQNVEKLCPGQFDVINCVGRFPGYRPVIQVSGREALDVFNSNYLTVYNVAHALIPLFRKRGGGNFVAFTSHSRYQAYPLMAAFDSSKAAVEQLIRHIANEESCNGLIANAFALATLATEEEFRLKPHGDHEHWLRPREVASAVCHALRSPAGLINGNTIHLYKYSPTYFASSYFDRIKP